MFKTIAKLFASHPSHAARTPLAADFLEARDVCSVSLSFAGGVLTITGTDSAEQCLLRSYTTPYQNPDNDLISLGVVVGYGQLGQSNVTVGELVSYTADWRLIGSVPVRVPAGTAPELIRVEFDGRGGNDWFQNDSNWELEAHGGAGADTIIGGSNDDVLFGDGQNDRLYGRHGSDRLYGGEGNDFVADRWFDSDSGQLWSGGTNYLFGGAGEDILWGGAGEDTLDGGQDYQVDHLWGMGGRDTFITESVPISLGGTLNLDINLDIAEDFVPFEDVSRAPFRRG